MNPNDKYIKKHHNEIKKTISKMRKHIPNLSYLSDGKAEFNGYRIDLSATNADPLSIAYTTLKDLTNYL